MKMSESINEIAKALSLFQGEIIDVPKEKSGYNYKYAELPSYHAIARPILKAYGLSVSQLVETKADKVAITTILMHESGQWLRSTVSLPVEKELTKDGKQKKALAQEMGSIITYLKRYSYGSILGFTACDEDLDANPSRYYDELMRLCSKDVKIQDRLCNYMNAKGYKDTLQIGEKECRSILLKIKGS